MQNISISLVADRLILVLELGCLKRRTLASRKNGKHTRLTKFVERNDQKHFCTQHIFKYPHRFFEVIKFSSLGFHVQVLIGVPELTAVSLRLPSSSTVASRSMSLVCRLLVVLLLAGQGRVLAMVNPEGLAECGDHCGGFFQVMCVAGCNCVPYKATTFGVCRPSVLNETELDYDELAACEETIQETMLGGTLRQRGLYRGCLTAPLPPVLSQGGQCLVKLQYPQLSRRLPLFTDVFVCENKTMTD
ncbi:uncharacterized protein [Dermacentor andersoni]|uniref:uncharacterized protein isoform X4 n=1 Tax=Dermacentor andersoni TaxID=34620 RepID=UPI002415AE91|nr:uncharacterized protein LOC129386741 isoform X4 [Dermacentor andersoni]